MTMNLGRLECEPCSGMGFLKKGEFGVSRDFVRCKACGGLGFKYLEPVREKVLTPFATGTANYGALTRRVGTGWMDA